MMGTIKKYLMNIENKYLHFLGCILKNSQVNSNNFGNVNSSCNI